MYHPLSAFIAMRYTRAGKQNSFVSFINRFSVAGIALGLAALIIVISVMNGFEGQLKKRILGIVPHIVVERVAPEDLTLPPDENVLAVSAYLENEGVAQSRFGLRGVQLQGVTPSDMQALSIVADHMMVGNFTQLQAGEFAVILGRALAMQLEVRPGDTLRLMVSGASVYTPFGRMPSQRLVNIVGVFSVGSQLDDKVIYMHQADLSRLMRQRKGTPPSSRIFLKDAFDYQSLDTQLRQDGLTVDNWRSRQGPLFDAVKMEKNMMFLMLLLIITVAAFNIVSALVMVVTEKQGDIAILQTQGMTTKTIMSVFVFNGMFNGLKGTVIGLLLGLVITSQLNSILALLGVNLALSADGQGVPVDLRWMQVSVVAAFAFGLCVIASLYPAYRALKVQPAQVLQNE